LVIAFGNSLRQGNTGQDRRRAHLAATAAAA
jgi:hypothetical protein